MVVGEPNNRKQSGVALRLPPQSKRLAKRCPERVRSFVVLIKKSSKTGGKI
jgi:hypothetical protein